MYSHQMSKEEWDKITSMQNQDLIARRDISKATWKAAIRMARLEKRQGYKKVAGRLTLGLPALFVGADRGLCTVSSTLDWSYAPASECPHSRVKRYAKASTFVIAKYLYLVTSTYPDAGSCNRKQAQAVKLLLARGGY